MNFTESFSEFSSRLSPMDLALYAGAGIVVWVLFKDKLAPVQSMVIDLIKRLKNRATTPSNSTIPATINRTETKNDKDLFFDLVVSWKQTRDLAVRSGCTKAIEVADQMFPYLSPEVCTDKETGNAE